MTALFVDSFDHYTVLADKWTTIQGVCAIGAGGRNATNGLSVTGNGSNVRKTLAATKATIIVGVGVNLQYRPNNNTPILSVLEGGVVQVNVQHVGLAGGPTGKLIVTRNGVTLGTSTTVLTLGGYYYVELKTTIGAAGAVVLRINGAVEINLAGVNTQATANAFVDTFSIGTVGNPDNNNAVHAFFDDLYVGDTVGPPNNDFVGDVRIVALLPNGAGGNTALTTLVGAATHWQATADNPPDADVSYVASATPGQIDTFAMVDLATVAGTIKGIQTVLQARKDDAGIRTIQPELRIAAVNYLVGAPHNLGTLYVPQVDVIEVSPATAAAFTIAEVNGLEAGLNIIA